MDKANELARQIDLVKAYKQELRKRERGLRAREEALSSEFQVPGSVENLKSQLMSGLPMHLMPLNVGSLKEAAWNFFYSTRFDFAGLSQLNRNIRETRSFQVSQEAAFIITHVSQNFTQGPTVAAGLAPWAIQFEDRQSTRKLNNQPMPIQTFGDRGLPTKLCTPFLVLPNAFLDVTLTCEVEQPYAIAPSDVNLEVMFIGIRMRIDQADKILSTIYR